MYPLDTLKNEMNTSNFIISSSIETRNKFLEQLLKANKESSNEKSRPGNELLFTKGLV